MATESPAAEKLSVTFSGPAFQNHEISAAALAQSLLALDSLAQTCGHAVYGHDAEIEVKVQGSPKPGSFLIDLIISHPLETSTHVANAVAVLTGVVGLAKWAYGKRVKVLEENGDKTRIENETNEIGEFEKEAVRIYQMSRTRIDLSRLTQTLDKTGAEEITLSTEAVPPEIITKSDRRFFRHEDGLVLTDNEAQIVLEVTGPRINGSSDGWIFTEGEEGSEFKAKVEDEEFLQAVKDGKYAFKSGTSILAVMRTLQVRKARTTTYRSIIQVLEVYE